MQRLVVERGKWGAYEVGVLQVRKCVSVRSLLANTHIPRSLADRRRRDLCKLVDLELFSPSFVDAAPMTKRVDVVVAMKRKMIMLSEKCHTGRACGINR